MLGQSFLRLGLVDESCGNNHDFIRIISVRPRTSSARPRPARPPVPARPPRPSPHVLPIQTRCLLAKTPGPTPIDIHRTENP
jgi:hypothetical protein